MQLRFHVFWAINDRLSEAGLCRQLDEMKRSGFDGVVWQPRFYPGEPEYPGVSYFAKNFANRPDAPESTRVEACHFKPWGVLPIFHKCRSNNESHV
ncbi:MAG: hypothetical protein V4819_21675 [Verrucomicrobiota bacterium]